MECAGIYLGLENCQNARYAAYQYPQCLYVLSDMLKLHVLRELGDIKRYIRMEKEFGKVPGRQPSKHDSSILAMMEWLDIEIDALRPQFSTPKEKIVISLLVWGETFVNKMLSGMFKSWMAEGNMDALSAAKSVILHIQTDAKSKALIEAAEITKNLKGLGVIFEYVLIPDNIISTMNDSTLYWMVGAGASISIAYAKKMKAAFHHSYPDIIYSTNYFSELLRLSENHKVILAPGARSDESIMNLFLKPYETEEKISVPSEDLMALHMNSLHMSMFGAVVNNRQKGFSYPQNHFLMWESEESVHFNCPHLNAAYIAPELMKNLEDRYYMSLDSELDLICTGEEFYIPQVEDKLYLVELSEQSRYPVNDVFVEASIYGNFLWNTITHRDLLKFFTRGMKVKINRDIRQVPVNVMSDVQIGAEKVYLMNSLLAADPYKGVKLARKRTHENYVYRSL